MAVKTTQFSYDDEWLKRKNKTGATWKQIMEAGIMALEEKKGIQAKAPKPEIKNIPEPEPPATPDVTEEVTDETPPKEPNPNQYFLRITKPDSVSVREFDILHTTFEDGNPVRAWKPCPFDEIELDAIFRIRDDGVILSLGEPGYKRFRKLSTIEEFEGKERVKVEVFENVSQQA